MLAMVGRAIHHLPLVADGRPVGIVTSTDLLRLEHANPVYLVGDVAKQENVAGVAAVCRRLPGVVERLVGQDASAHDIGRVVTTVGDAVERRLIALAERRLGPPPVPYC
jgi:CBS domain-containing protein